ncbi:hypothetical protein K0U83_15505 [bacterium]|nr:hypothetical protein [bacterium]
MADSTIEVLLKIKDLATKELDQFEDEVEKTGREAKKAFKKVDDGAKKARVSIKKLVVVAAAGFAVFKGFQKTNQLAIGFSEAAASAEEAEAKFNAVFKELSEGTEQTLGAFAQTVGRSTLQLKSFAASFQDIFVPLGLTRDSAADLSIALTALAVDVAAFSDRADKDVVRDFSAALVGSTETVRKYGIVLLETRVKAEALRLGLVKQGEALDEIAKLGARASLIFAGTADAQGAALREIDSFTSTLKRLKAAFSILSIEAGKFINEQLLKLIEEFGGVDAVAKRLGVAFKAIAVAFVSTTRVLAALTDGFLKFIESIGGGGQFVALIGQGFIELEFAIKKLIVRAPDLFISLQAVGLKTKLLFEEIAATLESIANTTRRDQFQARDRANQTRQEIFNTRLRAALVKAAAAVELSELKGLKEDAIRELQGFVGADPLSGDGGVDQSSFGAFIGALIAEEGGLQSFFDTWINGLVKSQRELEAEETALDRARARLAEWTAERNKAIPPLQKFIDLTKQFGAELNKVVQVEITATSATAGARSAFEAYGATLSEFNLGRNATAQLFSTIERGLFDVTGALIRGESSFSDFARNVAISIGEIIAQFYLLRAIRDGLGFSAGGLFGGGGLGGNVFALAKGGVMQGQMSNSLPMNGYANGGVANTPQMAIFGEGRGAEAFVPLPDGKNIPVKMEGGGGGSTVNITVTALDPTTAADVINANLGTITDGVANAIISGQNRKLVKAVGRG